MSATAVWTAISLTAVGCYLLKLGGLLVPADALERPLVRRLTALLPIALLAALTAQQTFSADGALVVLDLINNRRCPRRIMR
ncbi:AzlD domain-containing protein, partial [Streptomyces sp. Act-28]